MNLIVSGADESNADNFHELLKNIEEPINAFILSSKDSAALDLAENHSIETTIIDPQFDDHGRNAVYVANAEKIEQGDALLLLWNGKNKKDKDLLNKAIKSHLVVYRNV